MNPLLIIAPQHVLPPTDGGRAGIHHPMVGFAKHRRVFFAFPRPAGADSAGLRAAYAALGVHAIPLESTPSDSALRVLTNLFQSLPFKIRKYFNQTNLDLLSEIVTREGIGHVWINHLHMMPYGLALKCQRGCKVMLREHNIESEMYMQFVAHHTSILHRAVGRWQLRKCLRFERLAWHKADHVLFISDSDLELARSLGWAGGKGEDLIYDIIPLPETSISLAVWRTADPKAIAYPLRLAAVQNQFNAKWFLNKIWPAFHEARPEFRLRITGSTSEDIEYHLGMTRSRQESLCIEAIGLVDAYAEALQGCRYFLSPTCFGSGVRVKLIEAMGLGCLCLASDIDTRSIGQFRDGLNLLNFRDAETLASAVARVESEVDLEMRIRTRAQALARDLFHEDAYMAKALPLL